MRRFVGVPLLGLGLPLFPVGGWLIFLGIMVNHEPMIVFLRSIGIVAACVGLLMTCVGLYLLSTLGLTSRRFIGVLMLVLGLPLFLPASYLISFAISASHDPRSVYFLWMGIVATCAGLLMSCVGIYLLYDRNKPISSGQKRRSPEYRRCSNCGVCVRNAGSSKHCVHCGRVLG